MGLLLTAGAREWPGGRRLTSQLGAYTRTCAYRDLSFEVAILNWAPGAVSPVHDHGGQHCWMLVLEGRLDVEDFVRLDTGDVPGYAHVEARGRRRLESGEMDLRSGRFDLHQVAVRGDRSAVSLHVYSRPLRKFLVYDEGARKCEIAYGTYDEMLPAYAETVRG